ncbi:MAG: cytochrome ubiquinol oxidase subunit I [Anaerolineales bacterium]|jgi:cytochrome d ubiquinol oxidase subunit I
MVEVALARWQFAITSVYHFFFVPLTLGLSILVALMETVYVRTGDETYKRMAKFWGKLFLINFAMGVVTGIVMEFQFGMNWSEYSRFVGDIFGAPLAIEALLAFFLESTFLGIWVFGWERLSKGLHAATIWLVAIGSNLSALWILIANSFMQEPVGYGLADGNLVMTDFFTLLGNPHVWVQFPHVLASGMTTAAFFVLGISAYNLLRGNREEPLFRRSFRWASVYGIVAVALVIVIGHSQAQHMVQAQPMKMAAAEALWETSDPAPLSLLTIGDLSGTREVWSIRIPRLLSFLAYNRFDGQIIGLNDLQRAYEMQYGPGNYVPLLPITYWTFRLMVGAGFLMLGLAGYALYLVIRNRFPNPGRLFRWLPLAIGLPYLANTTGWLLTELGRQPWIVFGLQKTADASSPNVSTGMLIFSIVCFTLIYGLLMALDIYLLARNARPTAEQEPAESAAAA